MNNLKFLVVDDSATMRRMIINGLKTRDVEGVLEAKDGQDALAMMYVENIDFLITDWNMPNMNGLELIKEVRKEPRFKDIPILMVTSKGFKNDIIQAMKSGANSYIVKPFSPEILVNKIEDIINKT